MDGIEDSDGTTRLLVKAPDQQVQDQVVKCQLHWTVGRLKDHFEQVYPNKPKRCEQKMIFSGQLLNDSMILKDVFQQYYNQSEKTYIVHLVCKSSAIETAKSSKTIEPTRTAVNISTSPIQPSPLQQNYDQVNNEQIAWMQQAYAHYLTQYMQIMAARGVQWQNTFSHAQSGNSNDVSNNMNQSLHNNNHEGNIDPGRAVDQDNLEEPNALNNNDVGEDGEVGINRDWLDIFDILARLVVLSSIVYFYSSPTRFLVVSFLGFAIYLIQGGFLRAQPIFIGENINGRIEDNNQPGNELQHGGQQQRNHAQLTSNSTSDREAGEINANENNERPGAWAFTWTFLSSFFASLIPDQPPVV